MKKFLPLFVLLASPTMAQVFCSISLKEVNGTKITGADVVLVDRQKKIIYSAEYTNDTYRIRVPVEKQLVLAIAHSNFCASVQTVKAPSTPVGITLEKKANTGSVMAKSDTCYIPGFGGRRQEGRLAILSDDDGSKENRERLYLYADNISVEGGKAQPVRFSRRVPLQMEDSAGKKTQVEIFDVIGQFSILQYTFL